MIWHVLYLKARKKFTFEKRKSLFKSDVVGRCNELVDRVDNLQMGLR